MVSKVSVHFDIGCEATLYWFERSLEMWGTVSGSQNTFEKTRFHCW